VYKIPNESGISNDFIFFNPFGDPMYNDVQLFSPQQSAAKTRLFSNPEKQYADAA
jgi:hypothetical protein